MNIPTWCANILANCSSLSVKIHFFSKSFFLLRNSTTATTAPWLFVTGAHIVDEAWLTFPCTTSSAWLSIKKVPVRAHFLTCESSAMHPIDTTRGAEGSSLSNSVLCSCRRYNLHDSQLSTSLAPSASSISVSICCSSAARFWCSQPSMSRKRRDEAPSTQPNITPNTAPAMLILLDVATRRSYPAASYLEESLNGP